MKKAFVCVFLLMIVPSALWGLSFQPTQLELIAPDVVQYDFDGTKLEIPFTVTGTPASAVFLVYTKDKGESIGIVQNGYLGWHYVNKIDTCVYMSDMMAYDSGNNVIKWDGKDNDGGIVPAGEYTYYLWSYSSYTPKVKATADAISLGRTYAQMIEVGEDGLPLSTPFILSNDTKWVLGGDPADDSLVETTNYDVPEEWNYRFSTRACLDPTDYSIVYHSAYKRETMTKQVWKYKWVPNGVAEREPEWGPSMTYESMEVHGIVTDGKYLYTPGECHTCNEPFSLYWIIDFDGNIIDEIELDWWIRPDEWKEVEGIAVNLNGGPGWQDVRNGKIFLAYWFCMTTMIDPAAYLESGDTEDLTAWVNQNGDYVNDAGWEENNPAPWACFAEGSPHINSYYADANLFSTTPQYDMGAVSFALTGPDGTGIGIYAYTGETAGWKEGTMFCDYDSAYDGIYTDNQSQEEGDISGLWFVGQDSIKGIITSKPVNVAESSPDAFTVAQNTPNPFNPTTTINFTIPEAGTVTIDIFNVAGQKVDTIASAFMNAGSHTLTWDGSAFSAGVYFYTISSGEYSRTMKMTLLK